MRMRIVAAVALALGARTAMACITVDIPPRERFHNATVVVRGTAEYIFGFDVVKIWRGDAKARVVAEYDPEGCGSILAKDGTDYIVYTYEAPTLDNENEVLILHHAHLILADSANQVIAYLDGQRDGRVLGSRELVRVLSEWQRGKTTNEQLRRWVASAETRDVDDWQDAPEGPWSLTNEMLWKLSEWTRPDPIGVEQATTPDCYAVNLARGHVHDLLELFHRPPGDADECRDALNAIAGAIQDDRDQPRCASQSAPPG